MVARTCRRQRNREFEAFVAARYGTLVRQAYVMVGDREQAADLAHTALVCLLEHWRGLRSSDAAYAYAQRVMVNVLASQARRGQIARQALPLMVDSHPEAACVEERLTLWAALLALPTRQRAAVVLRYREDLPLERIAYVLGSGIGTVKTHLKRGLRTLRSNLPDAVGADLGE